ncbi:Cyclic AMP-dependent transcription factor ATF-4 [Trichoplax sp. H2]|nr:Cyclic AMP-dependent transcription factor ATF-4 [Trichoplax sp. H2]|eukprot:RDD36967.1 Cyclic AMP-dependent transcription factor ATF-4 [Trichoplax sp. H2]
MASYDLNMDPSIVSSGADLLDFPFDNDLLDDFSNENAWSNTFNQPVIASLAEKGGENDGRFDINALGETQLNKLFGLSASQHVFDQEAYNDTNTTTNTTSSSWIDDTIPDLIATYDVIDNTYANVEQDLLNATDGEFTSEFSSSVSSPFESTESSPLTSNASSPFTSNASSPFASTACSPMHPSFDSSPYPVDARNEGAEIKPESSTLKISKVQAKIKKNARRKRLNNLPASAKQQRKRQQNNNAALKYRLKKKEEVSSLSTIEKELETENMKLQQKIEATKNEIHFLASLLREIKQNREKNASTMDR